MDIKTLLDNLHDELSCSVCMCTFTDPKQLPCLHSFCLHCLNGIQRTSGVHGKITCPECRRQFQIHGSGNPSELPTNFRINSLLDVLAIKECSTANVKCGNCDKRSAQTFYCFQCCSFWCEQCILGHNIIRTNKEHKTLALKDFQDHDFEAVLKRPAFCQKKLHEKEELKFFCKNCEVAICNTCAMTLHEGHGKMLLQEATNARKTQLNYMIKSFKDKALEKRKEVQQFNQKSMKVQAQVADVKSQVQTNVDQIIAIIEARKQDVFDAVDNEAEKLLKRLSHKKGEVENQVTRIEFAIEQTESLLKRNSSTEILEFNETFETVLEEQSTPGNSDCTSICRFSFTKSEKLVNVLNSEGIGNVKTVFSETKVQQSGAKGKERSNVIAGNSGANDRDSPREAQVQTRRFRRVLSFGQEGTLHDPYSTNDDYLESPRDQSLYDIGPHTTSSTSYSSNSSTPVTTTLQRVFTNAFAPTSSDDIQLGMEVLVARSRGQIGRGKVKYVGPLPGRRDTYIGIELGPGQVGKHDGTFDGQRLFACEPNKGICVSFSKVVMCYDHTAP